MANSIGQLSPIAPGRDLVLLDVELHNHTRSPITLASVRPVGTLGASRNALVARIAIAPIGSESTTVPGGSYLTYPPVWGEDGPCDIQRLSPIAGAELAPHQTVRLFEQVHTVAVGAYEQSGVAVTYRQGGKSYVQTIVSGFQGVVRSGAPKLRLERWDIKCLGPGIHVLPGTIAGRRTNLK